MQTQKPSFTHMDHDIIKMRLDSEGKILAAAKQKNLKDTSHAPYKSDCGSCFAASNVMPKGYCCNT